VLVLFILSACQEHSGIEFNIINKTNKIIIVEAITKNDEIVKQELPYTFENQLNEYNIYSFNLYSTVYYNVSKLPELTDEDLNEYIKDIKIYYINNTDTFFFDKAIDVNKISTWKYEYVFDDQIGFYIYNLEITDNVN
jgi:hypothetical protein